MSNVLNISHHQKILCRFANQNDAQAILSIQKENLKNNIFNNESQSRGFLLWETSQSQLDSMIQYGGIIVAILNEEILGYLMILEPQYVHEFPFYKNFIHLLDTIEYKGQCIKEYNFFIIAQICVSTQSQGLGITKILYSFAEPLLKDRYTIGVGEIHDLNKHSLYVHIGKCGMVDLGKYDENAECWHVFLWDMVENSLI